MHAEACAHTPNEQAAQHFNYAVQDLFLACPGCTVPTQILVVQKQPLTAAALQSAIDNIRGAVMICYPQGLPEWDFVRQCLEEREDLTGTNVSEARVLTQGPAQSASAVGDVHDSCVTLSQLAPCNMLLPYMPWPPVDSCVRSLVVWTCSLMQPRCGLPASSCSRRRSCVTTWAAMKTHAQL